MESSFISILCNAELPASQQIFPVEASFFAPDPEQSNAGAAGIFPFAVSGFCPYVVPMTRPRLLCMALILLGAVAAQAAGEEENVPKDPFARAYQAALVAYKNDDYTAARQAADEAKKLRPDDPKLSLLLGRIATAQKDYPVAEQAITAALKADAHNTQAQRALGDLYFHQRDFPKATAAYEDYRHATAGGADALVMLAYCAIGGGDLAKAGEYARELIPFSAEHPGYNFVQAAIAKSSGNDAEAERQLQVARVNHGVSLVTEQMRDYLLLFSGGK
jgi:tetratricopeptide (TPR) repeat protein